MKFLKLQCAKAKTDDFFTQLFQRSALAYSMHLIGSFNCQQRQIETTNHSSQSLLSGFPVRLVFFQEFDENGFESS